MTFSEKAKDFSSSKSKCLFFMPAFVRAFLFKSSPDGELSYYIKNVASAFPQQKSRLCTFLQTMVFKAADHFPGKA